MLLAMVERQKLPKMALNGIFLTFYLTEKANYIK